MNKSVKLETAEEVQQFEKKTPYAIVGTIIIRACREVDFDKKLEGMRGKMGIIIDHVQSAICLCGLCISAERSVMLYSFELRSELFDAVPSNCVA